MPKRKEAYMSLRRSIKRPSPSDRLYDALFKGRTEESVVQTISCGIEALCANARRLFDDAKILTGEGRFATARFLLATVDEEAGKVYILLDMARLDFSKHLGELSKLCRAFYSHLLKHAYIEVTRWKPFNETWDLYSVQGIFDMSRKEYWEASFASGEPAMPSDHLINREGSLYVDFFSEGDELWWIPDNKHSAEGVTGLAQFRSGGALDDAERSLLRLEEAEKNGLFRPTSLGIFHQVFSKSPMPCLQTSRQRLDDIYDRVFQRLQKEGINLGQRCRTDNALVGWPLYPLISKEAN